jgi:RimJ/RimL family protein N-acetyltransferase
LQGLGLGTRLLLAGEQQMHQQLQEPFTVDARVLAGNTASQRLFEGCGYDGGPLSYQKHIGAVPTSPEACP